MDLDELERLLSAATPGPLKAGSSCVYVDTGHAVGDPDAPDTRIAACGDADAEAFATLRNNAADLLAIARAVHALGVARREQRGWSEFVTRPPNRVAADERHHAARIAVYGLADQLAAREGR